VDEIVNRPPLGRRLEGLKRNPLFESAARMTSEFTGACGDQEPGLEGRVHKGGAKKTSSEPLHRQAPKREGAGCITLAWGVSSEIGALRIASLGRRDLGVDSGEGLGLEGMRGCVRKSRKQADGTLSSRPSERRSASSLSPCRQGKILKSKKKTLSTTLG